MDSVRMLFTASRSWTDVPSVHSVVELAARYAFHSLARRLLVVDGQCSKGGDQIIGRWVFHARHRGWPVDREPHPASWRDCVSPWCRPGHRRPWPRGGDYCPVAGQWRNQVMVDLGAAWCVALVCQDGGRDSSGAGACVKMASAAAIPVFRLDWADRRDAAPRLEAWLRERRPGVVVPPVVVGSGDHHFTSRQGLDSRPARDAV